MEWISTFIAFLYIYNFVFDSISYISFVCKKKEKTSVQTKNKDKISLIDVIVFSFSIIIFFVLFFYLFLNKIFPPKIVIWLLVVPTALRFLTNSIKASGPIKAIVLGKYSNQDLSIKEKFCFDIIIGSFFYFFSNYYTDKVISYIVSLQVNTILIEIMLSIFILIYAFGLSFFAIEELILPIKHIHIISGFITNKYGKRLNKKIDQFISDEYSRNFVKAKFSNRFLSYSARYKYVIRVLLRILFLPYTLLIDIVFSLFICVFVYFFGFIVSGILEFFRIIVKGAIYLVESFTKIPEHLVIKNTFRVSFILSATVMVILNRFSVLIKCDEAFLAVTEFIASAIIIPIIFEWIYSNDKNAQTLTDHSTEQLKTDLLNIKNTNIKQNNKNSNIKHKYKRKRK